MSDRNKSNNTDNQNTATTYVPREAQEQYRQTCQNRPPQNNKPRPYPHPQQPQQPYPPQQPYQQPYPPQYQQPYPPQQQPYPPQYQQPYPPQQPYQEYPYSPQQPQQPYPPQRPYNPGNKPKSKKKKSGSPKSSGSAPKKKKKRKSIFGKFIGRLLFTLLAVLLILFGIYSCTVFKFIGKMDYVETGSRVRTEGALSKSYVRSVLIIGTDGRSDTERGRSDSMMLMSLNKNTNEMNLTSFMRDCYVEIPNYGWNKLNAAYSFGGAELLMDTIEHNFGVKIDDYVSVNFVSFANIVDSVGGIDIEITDAEAQEINTILQAEVNELMGDNTISDLLRSGGKLHLNGKQALSYSRIRYVGNADFERTERQRKVTELVLDKVKSFAPSALNKISESVLPNVTTNMTSNDLYMLSLRVPFLTQYETKQFQIPADNTYYGADYDVGNVLVVDFDANYGILKETVFAEQ